jgi:hypothetical protein
MFLCPCEIVFKRKMLKQKPYILKRISIEEQATNSIRFLFNNQIPALPQLRTKSILNAVYEIL